ncbi:DUF1304 domain-containing protein [Paucilactobacillus wasatchensis]|uniref:Putative membrane protein n=1 Tax=Paucilactobacillus wasatchensis TaxID=1335616 RepID=A0A0D0YW51_9LACO|nr:DUF1304 domain-containing protein [Paucilactobacillus wasatchensis]KIS03494.1 putative membrane protein [Paucilactobacillus wasatchensis]
MQIVGNILVILIGIEHFGIMLLEIFGSDEKKAQSFEMPLQYVQLSNTKTALANQGIYNGGLGLLLILATILFTGTTQSLVLSLLLGYVVVVAIFGGFTATKKIFVIQLLPALIALIFVLVA